MKRTIYIAGPMTGIPQFNFPAFDRAAALLRESGWWNVVSPSELDSPEDRARAMASPDGAVVHYENGQTWGDFLARDIKLIVDTPVLHSMAVLPGWERSRGARFETFTGHRMRQPGVEVLAFTESDPRYDGLFTLTTVPFLDLVKAWADKQDISFHSPVEVTA